MAGPAAEAASFQAPPRPEGLRSTVLSLYAILALTVATFVAAGEWMKQPVPKGKYQRRDGTLIDFDAYDPVELGPYPKCHPHYGEFEKVNASGARQWAKLKDVPLKGPFPPGHPDNPEFVAKRAAEMKRQNKEAMLTWSGLQPSLHLLSIASLCVLLGSKHGLLLFTEPRGAADVKVEATTLLKKDDAMWFPVMGSVLLFSLFVIYKYLGSDWIKFMISCYVVFMCMLAFGANVGHLVQVVRSSRGCRPLFRVPVFDVEVTAADLVGGVMGAVLSWRYIVSKNWVINNVFGLSFCLMGLKKIGISTFKTGAIMLIGLFLYDIFWVFGSKPVFGSNVMVTVAKGVEAPIKLMFPRSMNGCGQFEFSMLGLGDIVVPGIFIAFLAKWDAVVIGRGKASSFIYLKACMVAYFLSLATTVAVMLLFNAAQPALLYIVPYVLIASVATAAARGELGELWVYEIPDDEVGAEKSEETEEKEKKDS